MASGAAEAVLEIRDLAKSFGETEAVRGVSFGLRPGEYFCILGPSGCGKTTLLRLVAGFEEPDAGEILLDGRPLARLPPERRDVNIVFQSYALFPHLTVFENVAFGLRMKKRPDREVRQRVEEALRLVHLERLGERRPHQLSGGQQQRVALARALVNRPRVLLLDEPLSALDRSLRQAVQEELRAVQRETGIAFVHITHDQGEALGMADRLAVMRAGRFEQVGPPREVYHAPANRFVAGFLGAANLLEGELLGLDPAVVAVAGARLAAAAAPAGARPGGRVTVAVRPEAIRLRRPGGDGGVGRPNVLAGRIRRVAFAGPVVEWMVDVGPFTVDVHGASGGTAAGLPEGDAVELEVAPEDVVLLPPEGA